MQPYALEHQIALQARLAEHDTINPARLRNEFDPRSRGKFDDVELSNQEDSRCSQTPVLRRRQVCNRATIVGIQPALQWYPGRNCH
jgi:hypothetical protein